ncbi:hypothetical protein BD779DRAFT_1610503 [Infundibulicybe gibba]|nr:hypothetical protein BD779DRAFT_1610503 [Infundibulicybe gibba]
MSAYGDILPPSRSTILSPTVWPVAQASAGGKYLTVHHLTLSVARKWDGLVEYLAGEGEMGQQTFEAYFFAADVFVGIVGADSDSWKEWEECIVGYYYVKPNYPGRSSHICNAGFVVPPRHRGMGYGSVLSRSYVHYAPRLGYRGSVFNLVYVNNTASVKLWESLGFTKVGRIPRAGRLRCEDGIQEEFVDAWVFYKNFEDDIN